MVLGLVARRYGYDIYTESTTQWTVCTLIFFFGYSIGIDKSLLRSIYAMGVPAVLISFLGIIGSVVYLVH